MGNEYNLSVVWRSLYRINVMEKNTILLPNGELMPIIGFGTWQAQEKELEDALNIALEAGYRHIDTATSYENEKVIGDVLKNWFDSKKLKRSDIFIVTKLPAVGNRAEDVEKWIKTSLQNLQLEYLDLYLIHVPIGFEKVGDILHPFDENGQIRLDNNTNHVEIWAEMEKQVKHGRTKAIGLSNFNISQIKRILKNTKMKISMLQIELHVYFQQKELVKFCKQENIPITAYSPLGSRSLIKLLNKTEEISDMLQNDVVIEIAKKYKKSSAQILLRYIVQNGIVVIPKSINPQRIKENIQLFDWELNPEDMKKLYNLDRGESSRICDLKFFKGIETHPEYPF